MSERTPVLFLQAETTTLFKEEERSEPQSKKENGQKETSSEINNLHTKRYMRSAFLSLFLQSKKQDEQG